jgi:large subunit ribosomal protein L19e
MSSIVICRYHSFYLKCKGNQFKNKYVLIEAIHKTKSEEKRAKEAGVQAEAKKSKKKEPQAPAAAKAQPAPEVKKTS